MTRRLSPDGHADLKRLEGVRAHVYRDAAGLPTIGVGHLLLASDLALRPDATPDQIEAAAKARWSDGMGPAEIEIMLASDLVRFERAVETAVKVPLTVRQFDALVIFAFNVGVANFQRSTLVRRLNGGNANAVPEELAHWNKVRDPATKELRASNGLTKRRLAEMVIWRAGSPV